MVCLFLPKTIHSIGREVRTIVDCKIIGERLRAYRIQKGWSQEILAEKAELHHTYIGQLERGEKNATIESIYKVTTALDIPLSALFENISPSSETRDYASLSYDRIQKLPLPEQEMLYEILERIIRFKQGTNSH